VQLRVPIHAFTHIAVAVANNMPTHTGYIQGHSQWGAVGFPNH
jgi:hypothetical protein